MTSKIGTLRESSLHAALKAYYARVDDRLEVAVDGYCVDILQCSPTGNEQGVVEIQTGNFSALRSKLPSLLATYPVTVVYPIPLECYIQRVGRDESGREVVLSRRKSPKRGRIEALFSELVYLGKLAVHPCFSLKLAMIRETQIRRDDGRGSWRRRGVSIVDRRLDSVIEERAFRRPADYLQLIPETLPEPFSVKALAAASQLSPHLAGTMAYTLRKMGAIRLVGKQRNAHLYEKAQVV